MTTNVRIDGVVHDINYWSETTPCGIDLGVDLRFRGRTEDDVDCMACLALACRDTVTGNFIFDEDSLQWRFVKTG